MENGKQKTEPFGHSNRKYVRIRGGKESQRTGAKLAVKHVAQRTCAGHRCFGMIQTALRVVLWVSREPDGCTVTTIRF